MEYWEDLTSFGSLANVWLMGKMPKVSKERRAVIEYLKSLYPIEDGADPMHNVEQMQKFFHAALRQLPRTKELQEALRHPGSHTRGLSDACKLIMKDGPLRWKRDGKIIAEISDWKTLRARISEARRRDPIMPWERSVTTELWHGNKPLRLKKRDWELLYNISP